MDVLTTQIQFVNHSIERESLLPLSGGQQALLHRFGLEQVCRFPLGFDFAPEFNRDNDGSRFARLIGDDLDLRVFHAFSVPLTAVRAPRQRDRRTI